MSKSNLIKARETLEGLLKMHERTNNSDGCMWGLNDHILTRGVCKTAIKALKRLEAPTGEHVIIESIAAQMYERERSKTTRTFLWCFIHEDEKEEWRTKARKFCEQINEELPS